MNKETGRVGIKRYGGIIYEEFMPELRGINGVRVYQEMADNDDVVGAILFAIKMLIRQAQWSVQSASNDEPDVEAADFVESCMHDMLGRYCATLIFAGSRQKKIELGVVGKFR